MNPILKSLLIFVLLAAAGFAQKGDVIAEAEKFEQTMTKAKAGDAAAQNRLGVMYSNGEGVQSSWAEAEKWIREAAERGNADAQANFVKLKGEQMSASEMFMWLSKAADQGHALAQYRLGGLYESGYGVPKDLVQAHVWTSLSGQNGFSQDPDGPFTLYNRIFSIESAMTFDQKLEAAKKLRALNAEPRKPAASSSGGGGGGGGGGSADPSWVIGAVGIAWALVTLARRVSQR